jgi:hypothetical protein
MNWLQVLGSTKLSQINESEGHQFELVFPSKGTLNGESEFVQYRIKEAFASAFRFFPIPWVFFDIRFHAGIEDHFAVGFAVETSSMLDMFLPL